MWCCCSPVQRPGPDLWLGKCTWEHHLPLLEGHPAISSCWQKRRPCPCSLHGFCKPGCARLLILFAGQRQLTWDEEHPKLVTSCPPPYLMLTTVLGWANHGSGIPQGPLLSHMLFNITVKPQEGIFWEREREKSQSNLAHSFLQDLLDKKGRVQRASDATLYFRWQGRNCLFPTSLLPHHGGPNQSELPRTPHYLPASQSTPLTCGDPAVACTHMTKKTSNAHLYFSPCKCLLLYHWDRGSNLRTLCCRYATSHSVFPHAKSNVCPPSVLLSPASHSPWADSAPCSAPWPTKHKTVPALGKDGRGFCAAHLHGDQPLPPI